MRRVKDPFPPTPADFHLRVERFPADDHVQCQDLPGVCRKRKKALFVTSDSAITATSKCSTMPSSCTMRVK